MEERARLQARIENLKELRELVGILRAMAASHLHEAQDALEAIRRYVAVVEEAIAAAGTLLPRRILTAGPVPIEDENILILISSEHGFAGSFNDRLIDAARERLLPDQKLGIIGRRGAAIAKESGMPVQWSFPMATHVGGVISVTRLVADHLADVSGATVLFARYTGGGFEVCEKRILPLDPMLLTGAENKPSPLHHLPPPVLVERLAGEYLFAEISRAVMESMASENGMRLRVMDSARHNIDDKVDNLSRQEQHTRQEEITTELLDVVTGARAILLDN